MRTDKSVTKLLSSCDDAIRSLMIEKQVIDNQLAAINLTREALKLGTVPAKAKPQTKTIAHKRLTKPAKPAHHTKLNAAQQSLLNAINAGEEQVGKLAIRCRMDPKQTSTRCRQLVARGLVKNAGYGRYAAVR